MAKIFFWGLMISLLGSLPLGTLNVTAMQIAIQENIVRAVYFAIGCLIVEMVYVRLSLVGIHWVRKQHRVMKVLEWITLVIITILAIGSFTAAIQGNGEKNVVLSPGINRFVLGVLLSALNPLQIPFWFGWSSILLQKKILEPRPSFYNSYILGIGTGTLAGNCIFIFAGKYAAVQIADSQSWLNWVTGCIFAVTAMVQLHKMLFKKDRFYSVKAK